MHAHGMWMAAARGGTVHTWSASSMLLLEAYARTATVDRRLLGQQQHTEQPN